MWPRFRPASSLTIQPSEWWKGARNAPFSILHLVLHPCVLCVCCSSTGSDEEAEGNIRQRHNRHCRDGAAAAAAGSLELRVEELEKVRLRILIPINTPAVETQAGRIVFTSLLKRWPLTRCGCVFFSRAVAVRHSTPTAENSESNVTRVAFREEKGFKVSTALTRATSTSIFLR